MFRPRVIPVLLIGDRGHAIKTVRFGKKTADLGDPINVVSLFNAFQVDELIILDILATRQGRTFGPRMLGKLASEATMPLGIGGGLRTLDNIRGVLEAGAEKVVIATAAMERPAFISEATAEFGTSSITVCLDCRRDWRGRDLVVGARGAASDPVAAARLFEQMGAGEIIVQSVDRDGTMNGYDIDLLARVADGVGIPIVALGGAGRFDDLLVARQATYCSAFAAGSLFCFSDKDRGVLINYPDTDQLMSLVMD